tara:strand:+ start:484 stop:828 length:345 start_codon:yes stop_codon:yes gene_type:complete
MKHILKKILKETYNQQILNNICNQLSTGSNKKSPEFMNQLFDFINNSDLPQNIKEKSLIVFKKWKNDMFTSVQNGRNIPDSLQGSTGDSESDISDMYLTQIQDIICSGFMEELD